MFEIAEPRPAPFLLDRDAEQPELADFRPQLAREFVGAVDLVGARRDPVLREARHAVAQHVDIGAEPEIETRPGIRDHAASPQSRLIIARRRGRRRRRRYFPGTSGSSAGARPALTAPPASAITSASTTVRVRPGRSDLGAGEKTLADGRRQQVDLQLDGQRRRALRHQRKRGIAGRRIRNRRGHPAMQKAALLAEIRPERQRDGDPAGRQRAKAPPRSAA